LSCLHVAERHEAEATRPTRVTIRDHDHIHDLAETLECFTERVGVRLPSKTTYKELCVRHGFPPRELTEQDLQESDAALVRLVSTQHIIENGEQSWRAHEQALQHAAGLGERHVQTSAGFTMGGTVNTRGNLARKRPIRAHPYTKKVPSRRRAQERRHSSGMGARVGT
jgi:hypothetical protein